MAKLSFQQLLQFSEAHDPSEIIFILENSYGA